MFMFKQSILQYAKLKNGALVQKIKTLSQNSISLFSHMAHNEFCYSMYFDLNNFSFLVRKKVKINLLQQSSAYWSLCKSTMVLWKIDT